MAFQWNARTYRTAICIIGIVLAGGNALKDYRDYKNAGSTPQEMTIAQAAAASSAPGFSRRYVRLNEKLTLECSQTVQDTQDNAVTSTLYLAFDEGKQHAFLLHYQGAVDCGDAQAQGLDGLLVPASTKFWTVHGKTVPATPNPLMELRVHSDPEDLLQGAKVSLGVCVVAFIGLWILWRL